jgi:hypothetical protein
VTEPYAQAQVWPPLENGERLMSGNELFLRQVNPRHCDRGEVTHEAFRTTNDDGGKLSGATSAAQTPEGAYIDRCGLRPGSSVGTFALSMLEVSLVRLRCVDDSSRVMPPPTGHAYMDQRPLLTVDSKTRRDVRERLAIFASDRGCLHP